MMKAPTKTKGDGEIVKRVRAALQQATGVKEKKMFGSIAFLVHGKMCVTVRATRIMCRIDPAFHDMATERKGCRTVVMGGRQYQGYVYVDCEAVRTAKALNYWVKLALDYNRARNKIGGRKKQ